MIEIFRHARNAKGVATRRQCDMSKAQYILLIGIVSFYSSLFVMLFVRAFLGIWQTRSPQVAEPLGKISRVVRDARRRAWTNAVRRGQEFAQEATWNELSIKTTSAPATTRKVLC